jgi:hypothetical protein
VAPPETPPLELVPLLEPLPLPEPLPLLEPLSPLEPIRPRTELASVGHCCGMANEVELLPPHDCESKADAHERASPDAMSHPATFALLNVDGSLVVC